MTWNRGNRLRVGRRGLLAILIAALAFGGSALAERVVELALPYGDAAGDQQAHTIEFEGNAYVLSNESCSFEPAYAFNGEESGGICRMMVPGEQVSGFKEPEDLYLGQVNISVPSGGELVVLSGDRESGAYMAGNPIALNGTYTEYVHASLDENETIRRIDRVYLLSLIHI